ncbi:MAG: putative exported lipoprotein [Bacteroidetes bacterium]|nr:putative exported lipoprotein [Bacteroidota bacterium]
MKKVLILAAVMFVLLAGCTKDDTSTIISSDRSELVMSAGFSGTSTIPTMVDDFVSGHTVGVFVTGTGYTPKVAQYTFDGTLWNSPVSNDDKIYLSGNVATVYGFYPGSASVNGSLSNTGTNAIDVLINPEETSFTCAGQTDYMYATAAYNGSGYPLATAWNESDKKDAVLYFHHAMSVLCFVINKPAIYIASGKLTQIKLTGTGGKVFNAGSGTMDVSTGTISMASQSPALTFTGSADINEYNAVPSTKVVAKGLVVPDNSTSGITLSMIIDGKQLSGTLPSAAPADKWEAGKQYTYTVQFTASGIQVSSVSILNWVNIPGGATDVK